MRKVGNNEGNISPWERFWHPWLDSTNGRRAACIEDINVSWHYRAVGRQRKTSGSCNERLVFSLLLFVCRLRMEVDSKHFSSAEVLGAALISLANFTRLMLDTSDRRSVSSRIEGTTEHCKAVWMIEVRCRRLCALLKMRVFAHRLTGSQCRSFFRFLPFFCSLSLV